MSENKKQSVDVSAENTGESPKRPSFLKRAWKFTRRLMLVCLILGGVTAAWMLQLARTEPAAFKHYDEFKQTNSPQQIQSMAQQAQGKLESLVTNLDAASSASATSANVIDATGNDLKELVKDDSEIYDKQHKLFMTSDELNAVLITSLEEWVQERGYNMPSQISDPMIALDGDEIIIGFRVNYSGVSQSLTAPVGLKFVDNGKIRVQIKSYHAGTLPIPADSLGVWLGKKEPNNTKLAQAAQWLDKLDGIEIKPVIKLATRHRAWITNYQLIDNGIELTIKMQPPKQY